VTSSYFAQLLKVIIFTINHQTLESDRTQNEILHMFPHTFNLQDPRPKNDVFAQK